MTSMEERHFHKCTSAHSFRFVHNQRATIMHKVLLRMTADGRHKQNLFRLLSAPQTLYIGLTIKVTD